MIVALLGAALATPTADDDPGDFHIRLDLDASWGIGSQMFLGTQSHLLLQTTRWQTARATGTIDGSLRLAYGNEAQFLAPWLDPETSTSVGHRIQLQVGVGHTAHLTPSRRFAIGIHALVGLNHYIRQASIDFEAEDVSGSLREARTDWVLSGELTLAYRLSNHIGINLAVGAPVPSQSSYIITMLHTSLGLSVYLK